MHKQEKVSYIRISLSSDCSTNCQGLQTRQSPGSSLLSQSQLVVKATERVSKSREPCIAELGGGEVRAVVEVAGAHARPALPLYPRGEHMHVNYQLQKSTPSTFAWNKRRRRP
jgi:hypothetical protein